MLSSYATRQASGVSSLRPYTHTAHDKGGDGEKLSPPLFVLQPTSSLRLEAFISITTPVVSLSITARREFHYY